MTTPDTAARPWCTFAPVQMPKPKGYPGDCAVWNAKRQFWCTLPRGHAEPHASVNQGQIMDRWIGGSRD